MKVPSYRKRNRAELRRALRWAQRKLHLRGWTLALLFDEQADASRHFAVRRAHDRTPPGEVSINYGQLDAVIGLWSGSAVKTDRDPLHSLFHEMGHVATAAFMVADADDRYCDLWEIAAYRVAYLLYDLWGQE